MTENNTLHVHKVIEFLGNTKKQYTKESLKQELENKHNNQDLKFETCASNSYNYDEIIKFMIEKEKIQIDENNNIKFTATVCSH